MFLFVIEYLLTNINIDYTGLRDYQKIACKQIIINYGGILSLPTGSGKTVIGLKLLEIFNQPSLVIVPTLDLKLQWEKRLKTDNIEVRTYQSLKSKSYLKQFKVVIFDECHVVAAKSLQLIGLNLNEDTITIGLSATPVMRDDDNLKVFGVLGNIVYELGLKYLINKRFLTDAIINITKLKPFEDPFLDYNGMYNTYIINNPERNKKICKLAENHNNVLILVDRIEHGKLLYSLLDHRDVVFLHGKSKNRDDLNHHIIIATSIFDLGIDIPRLETLILAGGGKSTIKTIQRMGRVLRLFNGKNKAQIFDFYDDAKWLEAHSKERIAIFKENFQVKYI